MKNRSIEDLARREPHRRLLRFISASPALDVVAFTPRELRAVNDLAEQGLVERAVANGSETVSIKNAGRVSELLGREVSRPVQSSARGENDVLFSFIQDLTRAAHPNRSVEDLFDSGFHQLSGTMNFDVGVAVMIEENLDLYLSRRKNLARIVDDPLNNKIKEALQSQIPVSFTSTDAQVRADFAGLPARETTLDPLTNEVHTLIQQETQTAGMLVLYRGGDGPFSGFERRLVEVLASHVSMALGGIRAHERIQNLADTDEMTGIWNKRYLKRQLPGEMERARIYNLPLSLVMLDVDDFKKINDRHGHTVGDVILSELCGTVRETLRPPDCFARFGGDEFAIILPHTDQLGARSVAERILQRVRRISVPSSDQGRSVHCSVSMGVATFSLADQSMSDLIRRADDLLYSSKRNGKGRYTA